MKNLWCTYIDNMSKDETQYLPIPQAMHALCDEIDRRLSALERPEAKPDTDGREWIPWDCAYPNDLERFWVCLKGGIVVVGKWRICKMYSKDGNWFGDHITHIMPYHSGDPKPEPPKGDK